MDFAGLVAAVTATAVTAFADAVGDTAGANVAKEAAKEAVCVLREVAFVRSTLALRPACIVRYDRLAFQRDNAHP